MSVCTGTTYGTCFARALHDRIIRRAVWEATQEAIRERRSFCNLD